MWIFGILLLATDAERKKKHAFWRPLLLVLVSSLLATFCVIFSYHATAQWGGRFDGLAIPAGLLSTVFAFSAVGAGIRAIYELGISTFD